jgi:hypothetical protein
MSFDDEVDEVKKEMQTAKLDPAARKENTAKLCEKLKEAINSRRLDFSVGEEDGEPVVEIKHREKAEMLASVYVNDDGTITFQPEGVEEEGEGEGDDYYSNAIDYYDEDEFLEDARDILKLRVAEFELDREGGTARTA